MRGGHECSRERHFPIGFGGGRLQARWAPRRGARPAGPSAGIGSRGGPGGPAESQRPGGGAQGRGPAGTTGKRPCGRPRPERGRCGMFHRRARCFATGPAPVGPQGVCGAGRQRPGGAGPQGTGCGGQRAARLPITRMESICYIEPATARPRRKRFDNCRYRPQTCQSDFSPRIPRRPRRGSIPRRGAPAGGRSRAAVRRNAAELHGFAGPRKTVPDRAGRTPDAPAAPVFVHDNRLVKPGPAGAGRGALPPRLSPAAAAGRAAPPRCAAPAAVRRSG